MSLQELTEQGFADFFDLDKANAIKSKRNLGINEFGFMEKEIIDTNDNVWEYIPEDNLYELKRN